MYNIADLELYLYSQSVERFIEIKRIIEYSMANMEGQALEDFITEALDEIERLSKIIKEFDNE